MPATSGLYEENATGDLDADDADSNFNNNNDVDNKIEQWNEISAERRPPPPKEDDVDDNGEFLYCPPELLSQRQMHVLRDGDRILMARAQAHEDDDINSRGEEEEEEDDDDDDNAVGQWTMGERGTAVSVDNSCMAGAKNVPPLLGGGNDGATILRQRIMLVSPKLQKKMAS